MTQQTQTARDDRAAVDKAISLLTAFGAEAQTGIGVSELARRCGMSKSTAFRLLGTLQRNGVVERCGTAYRVGSQLRAIAAPADSARHSQIRDTLTPFLADLYETTHQTVHLAVLQGSDVVYLNKLFGHRTAPAPSRIGGRAPAHCTAVGKVLLAYDSAAREGLTGTTLRRVTPRTITEHSDLEQELDGVWSRGVALDRDEAAFGLSCLAAPVVVRGAAVAALSISGRSDHFEPSTVEPLLRQVCHLAGQRLSSLRVPPRSASLVATA